MSLTTLTKARSQALPALVLLMSLAAPAFAQTQSTSAPPPTQASSATPAQAPAPPPVAPPSERTPTDQDYAAERAVAIDLHQKKELLKALPILEDLYSKNQNDTIVLEYLTTSLLARSATQTDPDAAKKDNLRAKAMIDRARALGDQSQLAENLSESMKGMDANSTLSFSDKADADAAMKAGEAAFAKNDYDEAIKNYKHATELEPSNYFATLFVGDAYFAKKDFAPAGEWYTKAQVLDPDRETAFRYHADMLTKQGDFAGARTLSLEAIVAAPYDPKTWRALVEWSKVAHATLQRVHIETGATSQPGADGKVAITMNPNQPADLMGVWMLYAGTRAAWPKEKFAKQFPNEKQYRHSLAEEVDALTTTAQFAESKRGSSALDKDPNVQLLLKLYRANMLEPYVLLNGADQGIAQDYVAYRAQNRQKLVDYLGTYVAPASK
jgi:tetratricopeptide (TPR) repeat protein